MTNHYNEKKKRGENPKDSPKPKRFHQPR
jgi:hypothetical protein